MKVLLDTHAWLWMQVSPERFSKDALAILEDRGNELFFSAASSWEISIKYALKALDLPLPPAEYVPDRMRSSGVVPLPVLHVHTLQVAGLPHHHRDPFDRLLIAQSQLENLPVLTSDPKFEPYGIVIIPAV
jgi:PIN domain nuclease of toxin-antitoxin system